MLSNFPLDFQKDLKVAKNKSEAKKVIEKFIAENFGSRTDIHKRIINDLRQGWKENSAGLIKKLEKVYGKPFPFEEITVYLVSNKICPYNYGQKWIMVYAKASVSDKLGILLHELNHFMFYYYISGDDLELNKKHYEALKEAVTVFTNPNEMGYPDHQKLRAWLKRQKGTIPEILKNERWRELLPK